MQHLYVIETTRFSSPRPRAWSWELARLTALAVATLLSVLFQGLVCGQTPDPQASSEPSAAPQGIKPVPLFSGSAGFITTFDGGDAHLGPIVMPVVLVPLGQRWLVETRA